MALTAVGLFTAFYAVAIGITQRHPKTVLAYSSVSQMGVVAAVLGMGLAADESIAALAAAYLRGPSRAGEGRAVPRGGRGRRNRSTPRCRGS